MWECIYKNESENIQKFKNNEGNEIITPLIIGNRRYKIFNILSNDGGYGVIYEANDTVLKNRKVLIKARKYDETIKNYGNNKNDINLALSNIRRSIKSEYEALINLRKQREARMPSVNDVVYGFCPQLKLSRAVDIDIYNTEPYIVMQTIEGENLGNYVTNQSIDTILNKRGYNDLREWEVDVLSYSLQIATILEGMHKRTDVPNHPQLKSYFVYQDLKPHNIIMTDDRFITLIDFGAVTRVIEKEDGYTYTQDSYGSPGVGTVGYRAPEMNEDKYLIDERVDIYSLGATMYHLLTGIALNEYTRIDLSNIQKKYNKVTYNIIKKCIQEDRDKRYRNMREFRNDILAAFNPIRKGI